LLKEKENLSKKLKTAEKKLEEIRKDNDEVNSPVQGSRRLSKRKA
jgi:exonuclease VII small subunit